MTGVRHLLVEKKKDKAPWSPQSIEDVKDGDIERKFFDHLPDRLKEGETPRLNLMIHRERFYQYPHRIYSLPGKEDVREIVTGEHRSSGSFAMSPEEVIKIAMKDRSGKKGIAQKIRRVLRYCCTENEDGLLSWKRK